jgi:hypothetical protein
MTVHTALASTAELSKWLDSSIRDLDISGDREVIAGPLFDQVHEHYKAIQLLLASSFYGSAFSLFRSIFETYVRGVWLLRCASEDEVENFREDIVNKSLGRLIKEIEKQPGYDVGVLSQVWKKAWSAMCSYAHGGSFPTARRITLDQIKPNYSEAEKLEVINSSSTVALLAASEIFSMANRNDLNEAALERMRCLRMQSTV